MSDLLCPTEEFLRKYRQRVKESAALKQQLLPPYLNEIGHHVAGCQRCQHRILDMVEQEAVSQASKVLPDLSQWESDPKLAWDVVRDFKRPLWVRVMAISCLVDVKAFHLINELKKFARDQQQDSDLRDQAREAAASLASLRPGLVARLRAAGPSPSPVGPHEVPPQDPVRAKGRGPGAARPTLMWWPSPPQPAPAQGRVWLVQRIIAALLVITLLEGGGIAIHWVISNQPSIVFNHSVPSPVVSPAIIEVISPAAGTSVSLQDTVRFSVSGPTPSDAVFVAYVLDAEGCDDCWWPTKCEPDPAAGSGHFIVQVRFGLPDEHGARFTVKVILVRAGRLSSGKGPLPPTDLGASSPITLTRK